MTDLKVLVPLDGSRFAESALPAALGLARNIEADLELVTVYDEDPTVGGWPLSAEGVREWSVAYADNVADALRARTTHEVTSTVLGGRHVAKTLERHVNDSGAGLVVMSSHGRGPFARAWLGSVADHIVRHGTVPVLVVRPDPDAGAAPSLDDAPSLQRILLPLDGSDRAYQAVPWALRVGAPSGAMYTLLRAVPPPMNVMSPYLPHTITETRDVLEEGRAAAEEYLADVTRRLARDGIRAASALEVGVRPATAILHYAERHPVDLIVLATHGRGGLTRAVLGSVADKVVRAAPVPVLLVRADAATAKENRS